LTKPFQPLPTSGRDRTAAPDSTRHDAVRSVGIADAIFEVHVSVVEPAGALAKRE
jgi:hypothetical protein